MAGWLKKEIHPISNIHFDKKTTISTNVKSPGNVNKLGEGGSDDDSTPSLDVSSMISKDEYSLYLRNVTILDNKKMFGLATAVVQCIVVNGLPDMGEKKPFWSWQMSFPNVADGTTLPIGSEYGVQVFNGKPLGFLNFYILVSRDEESAREFVALLQKNMDAKDVGNVIGELVPIFSALSPTAAILATASKLVTDAVQTTMDYFEKRKDPVIGVYVTTLPKEKDYGSGLHPSDYPNSLIDCQKTMEIGYEVTKHD